jgi:hypothetical protein
MVVLEPQSIFCHKKSEDIYLTIAKILSEHHARSKKTRSNRRAVKFQRTVTITRGVAPVEKKFT